MYFRSMANFIEPIQIDVHYVFNLLKDAPDECESYLRRVLDGIDTLEALELGYASIKRFTDLKVRIILYQQWKAFFPSVFISTKTLTNFKANYTNKVKFKLAGIDFWEDSRGVIILESYTCDNIAIVLQLLLYVKENASCAFSTRSNVSETATYFNNLLGSSYTEGQIIDWVDLLFDQYKHTFISVKVFRCLFRCFGVYLETIGNDAFDYYMESKDPIMAWMRSVENFLRIKLELDTDVSQRIAALLITAN